MSGHDAHRDRPERPASAHRAVGGDAALVFDLTLRGDRPGAGVVAVLSEGPGLGGLRIGRDVGELMAWLRERGR